MKSAYTLIEVVEALVIIAIAALALFEVLGNVLAGMNKVAYESKKPSKRTSNWRDISAVIRVRVLPHNRPLCS
ncbi:MAG: type II secretion system protein [Thermotoga caldifontis]|uniref:type II secretion system protein n=1 Tax=Thermotoga caldifontis TaxID=1508419 RepID=UPI003C7A98E4